MRALFVLLCVTALLPLSGRAEGPPVDAADRAAITSMIASQLDAFQRDDGAAAFAFAAPEIQQQFGTPENFMTMVRRGYPPVYRPRSVEFQALEERGGRPVVPVILGAPDGHLVLARYSVRQLDDGSWRISGCTLEKLPDLGV